MIDLPDKEPQVQTPYGIKIPVSMPDLSQEEMRFASDALQSTWISGNGKYIDMFEEKFSAKTGAKYAVGCNSGTSALHVGYRLLGIERGDEVIIPSFTMVSTATPLIEMGAKPIFIDADTYWQIDVSQIEKKITKKTKAIVGVHIYGHPCDIDAIEAIAKKHGLKTMYDAAESHGAKYKKHGLGEFGDVVAYSFYANKNITMGEGGVITTNKKTDYEKAKRLIDEYFSPVRHFWHESYGYSYRLNNVSAAIGCGQMERWNDIIDNRKKMAERYMEYLQGVEGISFMPVSDDVIISWWMFGLKIDRKRFGMSRNDLREVLATKGIETRTAFIPLNHQPVFKEYGPHSDTPVADELCSSVLYLPSFSRIQPLVQRFIADRIIEAKL